LASYLCDICVNIGDERLTPAALTFLRRGSWRLCIALQAGVCACLVQQSVAAETNHKVRFEIEAQPIIQALDQYSAVTGRDIFYDGALARGRRSSPLNGVFAPDLALNELLIGTGLTAKATGKNSFTLKTAALVRAGSLAFQSYFAHIQTKVAHAFCSRAETQSAGYDRLIRIWVASNGSVERAQLVNLSEEAQSKAGDIGEITLRGLPVGVPPEGMPQPVVMAILAGAPLACSEATPSVR
jgi:hypothetical protein